jgi:hypothetical protein
MRTENLEKCVGEIWRNALEKYGEMRWRIWRNALEKYGEMRWRIWRNAKGAYSILLRGGGEKTKSRVEKNQIHGGENILFNNNSILLNLSK